MADAKGDRDRGAEVVTDLVEYLIIGAPDVDSLASVADALSVLVRAGTIHLLDLVVVVRASDGTVEILEVESIDSLAPLREVEGELGGLLTEHDLELAAFAIQPGSVGMVLVTEDRWAEPLSAAARLAGGLIIAGERIPAARVEAVLADRTGDRQGNE
jgi:CBS domain-containing protein